MKACLSGQLSIVRILAALDSRSMNQKNSVHRETFTFRINDFLPNYIRISKVYFI